MRPVLTRRQLGRLAAAGILLPLSQSCQSVAPLPGTLTGTFLQVWSGDLKRSAEAWHESFYLTRLLGCTEITIQWLSYGPDPGAYQIPPSLIEPLLDYAAANTLSVRLGLPYDHRFWDVVAGRLKTDIDEFLTAAAATCIGFMRDSKLSRHRAFAGWYLPYEIEQYSWRYTADAARLIDFLNAIAVAAAVETLIPVAVSTFASKLAGGETLAVLWQRILDRVMIRPMVQDGVGTAGLNAYQVLRPTFAMLSDRSVSFDVVIELFAEKPEESRNGTEFAADSARYGRVREQIALALATGAERLVGFAVDPYMIGNLPGARHLLEDYRAGLSARLQPQPGYAMLGPT